MRRIVCLFSVMVAIACGGCSQGPTIVPVSGQVLIDGKPLDFGYVRFSCGEGRVSMGKLDKEGRFRLSCYEPGDGAIVGTHRIAVQTHEPIGGTKIKWHAPRKYANYATSGLTEEITEPTDSLIINLTWGNEKASANSQSQPVRR